MSNFAYVLKLVGTAIAKQLQHYLFTNDLLPASQSAYHPNHCTETSLLKVTSDILLNTNNQCVTLLLLLDLSAPFDTVIMILYCIELQFSFCIQGKVLFWFKSYLSWRCQQVLSDDIFSDEFCLRCIQVSFLRLLKPICLKFIVMHSQILHRFTFRLALILSVKPAFSLKKNGKLHIKCLWMLNDNLKLNDDKTEFLIIGTPQQLEKVDIMSICVGNSDIDPVPTARNLSSWFDSRLSMSTQITKI